MDVDLFAGDNPIPWCLDCLPVFLLARLDWSLHALRSARDLLLSLQFSQQFLSPSFAKASGHKKLSFAGTRIAYVVAVCHWLATGWRYFVAWFCRRVNMVAQRVYLNLPRNFTELLVALQDVLLHQSSTIVSKSISCTLALDVFRLFAGARRRSWPLLLGLGLSTAWDFDFLDWALGHILSAGKSGAEDLVLILMQENLSIKAGNLTYLFWSLVYGVSKPSWVLCRWPSNSWCLPICWI